MFAAAEELVAGGCTLLQYRNKSGSARRMLDEARELRARLGAGVKLIMNDRADLCLAARFDGLHVGQDDLSARVGTSASSGLTRWLGVSTHNPEQLAEADQTSADYLAIGPIFATGSKANPDPVVGLEGVRRARELTRKPLVAIGGITRGQCSFRHRRWRRCGGSDIRLVTGSPQISRGIFEDSGVKLSALAANVRIPEVPCPCSRSVHRSALSLVRRLSRKPKSLQQLLGGS